ncbi:MAG: patatin family protein [Oscillospiraceae bacterium]|nr:patatin family protein [Oscillospiraceae bacterium]
MFYENTGLVLEGGGMRGSYTAGVLDYFMEKGLMLSHVYGVSAGALIGANYVCGQVGRGFRTLTGYIGNKDYSGLKHLVKEGNWFNVDFSYNRIPNELDPADYDSFSASPMKFFAVIANLETGCAEYPQLKDLRKDMDWLRASASLPLLSKPVPLGDGLYLDGGISDSIPLEKSVADGNTKNVVILTQHREFVKKPSSNRYPARLMYRKYPAFVKAMDERHNMYNRQTEYVYQQEKAGTTYVIQPQRPVEIARLEKDTSKLRRLYDIGYRDGKKHYENIIRFLSE